MCSSTGRRGGWHGRILPSDEPRPLRGEVGAAGSGRGRRLAGTRPEGDGDRLRVAVALDGQLDLVAGLVLDGEAQIVAVVDLLAVDLGDDVAGLEARLVGRRRRAPRRSDAAALGVADADPEVGVLDLAAATSAARRCSDRLDRDGVADARVGAGLARDLRVHPDHAAFEVEQRAAGVAVVQRGVGLDRAVDREAVRAPGCRGPAPLTMPAVTVPSSPNGLPIATTGSPSRRSRPSRARAAAGRRHLFELQERHVGRRVAADHVGLEPRCRSWNSTVTSSAPSTTCWFVTMWPSSSRSQPLPVAILLLAAELACGRALRGDLHDAGDRLLVDVGDGAARRGDGPIDGRGRAGGDGGRCRRRPPPKGRRSRRRR